MLSIVHTDQESKGADANHDAEDSSFISLGQVTHAVVMRLSSDLPRIRVLAHLNSSEGDRGDGLA